jgi:hypothetical protein
MVNIFVSCLRVYLEFEHVVRPAESKYYIYNSLTNKCTILLNFYINPYPAKVENMVSS